MKELLTASINLDAIKQELVIHGRKGNYVNLTIWVDEKPDQYGNDVQFEQRTEKGQDKIYLGNGRKYKKP